MPLLCYHSVDESWQSPLAMRPAHFAAQCAWLQRHANVRRTIELAEDLDAGRASRRTVSFTFDDGFSDFLSEAVPTLARYAFPATMFLVARTMEEPSPVADWLSPAPSTPPSVLTREQVLMLHERGIEFGSHSWAHHDLRQLGEAECVRDLRTSRECLEDLLGTRVELLAYPYGFHAPHVRRAAAAAGYRFALSLPEGPEESGAQAVPRVGLYRGDSVAVLRLKMSRAYLPLRMTRLYPPLRFGVRRWRDSTSV